MPTVLAFKFESFDWIAIAELLLRSFVSMETDMADKAHIVHHIPGRVRLRVPSKKNDHAFFNEVSNKLSLVEGTKSVAVTPQTGSVLLHYDGDLATMLVRLAATGLSDFLELEMGHPPISPVSETVVDQVLTIDRRLQSATAGHLDAKTLAIISLLIATGVQIFRGQIFGPAVPLLWYAAETVRRYTPNRRPEQLEVLN